MHYDLDVISELCQEIGFPVHREACKCVEIDLGQDAILCFQNAKNEGDSLIGFAGMPWHTHDDLMFTDNHGNYINLDYLDVLVGLKDGKVLICEQEVGGRTVDRWLAHADCNDELTYLHEGERVIIRRAMIPLADK